MSLYQNLNETAPHFQVKEALWNAAIQAAKNRKIALEFGTGWGMSANVLALGFNKLITFDWFGGLTENWRKDFPAGSFKQDARPALPPNCQQIEGKIDETLVETLKTLKVKPSFFHFDFDTYTPTKYALDTLSEQDVIQSGAVFLFDEFYNYPEFLNHEMKAFKEWTIERGFEFEWIGRNVNGEQVALKIK